MNNRKQQTRRKGPKPKRTNKPKVKPVARYINLSSCATSYLRALTNPFSHIEPMPCIPDMVTIPSYKFRTVCRGVAQIGINGIGAAIFCPWTSLWSNNGINDHPLLVSNGANTWTESTNLPAASSADWIGVKSNSIFDYSTVTANGVAVRLVAAGIRVRYTGTTLNMGGQVNIVRMPSNNTIIGTSKATAQNYPNTTVAQVSRGDHFVTYYPDYSQWLAYTTPSSFGSGGVYGDLWPLGFYLTGVPLNTFYVECVSYFEVIGTRFQPTPSHMDSVGYSAVMTAAQSNAPVAGSPSAWYSAALSRIGDAFVNGISSVSTQAGSAAAATAVHLAVAGGKMATKTIGL